MRPAVLRRLRGQNYTDADFHKLIEVDPRCVVGYQDVRLLDAPSLIPYDPQNRLDAHRFVLANMGKVVDGDWDQIRIPFVDNNIHRLLREHFVDGVPWEQTAVFRLFEAAVARGERPWQQSSSREDLMAAAKETERLYSELRESGYRANKRGNLLLPSLDEVTVSIGRNGELLYNNVGGHHRLSLAKILEIPAIPVRVLLRHRQWQGVRDAVRRAHRRGNSVDLSQSILEHPDLRDMVPRQMISV